MNSFYVVWNPQHGNPKFRHKTRQAAQQEAERLANLNPGQQFFVLEAQSVSSKVTVQTTPLFSNPPF